MSRDALACIFASVPIIDCGRDMRVPEPVLASSWPLAALFAVIAGLAVYAFLLSLYPMEIDWEPDADRPLETVEDRARKAEGA